MRHFFVGFFLSSSCATCGMCPLSTVVWFSSSCYGAFWCVGDLNGKADSIKTSSQIMVVSMLQNLSHMYYSHHRIIKYVGFKPIHCAINLDIASSSRVLHEFDYMSIEYITSLNQ